MSARVYRFHWNKRKGSSPAGILFLDTIPSLVNSVWIDIDSYQNLNRDSGTDRTPYSRMCIGLRYRF